MLLLVRIIDLYSLIVLAGVIMSWIGVSYGNPLAEFVHNMTEPLLAPIRRVLPPMGGLDFSPLVLLIGLRVLSSVLIGSI
jgi:YggT family protein